MSEKHGVASGQISKGMNLIQGLEIEGFEGFKIYRLTEKSKDPLVQYILNTPARRLRLLDYRVDDGLEYAKELLLAGKATAIYYEAKYPTGAVLITNKEIDDPDQLLIDAIKQRKLKAIWCHRNPCSVVIA